MSSSNSPRSSRNTPVYHAFHVKDEYWTKIGAAWNTKSGKGLSVALDLLPPDGRFVLMEPKANADWRLPRAGKEASQKADSANAER